MLLGLPSTVLLRSSRSRSLVMIEQLAGVAYIAVVVSRLVALTIPRPRSLERAVHDSAGLAVHGERADVAVVEFEI